MRNRTVRTFVAWACTFFVFLLFAFPNYCDRCRYRDVTRILAEQEKAYTPSCCAKNAGTARADGGKSGAPGSNPGGKAGASHTTVPYCISTTLASIAECRDIVAEILLTFTPAPYRTGTLAFTRPVPFFDHKESRGPPSCS